MRNLKKPQKNISEFLNKACSLKRLLESSQGLDLKTKENIYWYCEQKICQYYKKCFKKKSVLK